MLSNFFNPVKPRLYLGSRQGFSWLHVLPNQCLVASVPCVIITSSGTCRYNKCSSTTLSAFSFARDFYHWFPETFQEVCISCVSLAAGISLSDKERESDIGKWFLLVSDSRFKVCLPIVPARSLCSAFSDFLAYGLHRALRLHYFSQTASSSHTTCPASYLHV